MLAPLMKGWIMSYVNGRLAVTKKRLMQVVECELEDREGDTATIAVHM